MFVPEIWNLEFMGFWAIVIVLPSAIWLIGVILWRTRGTIATPQKVNSVTAITVARNEGGTIRECLESLLLQQPRLSEILVYDDASTDGTRETAEEYCLTNPNLSVFSLSDEGTIPSPKKRALADGFSRAQSDYVAVTDADCAVPSSWANALCSELDSKSGAVLGASWPLERETFSERAYRWERLTANTLMASACGWGFPASACGHSILYSKKALHEVDAPVHREIRSGDDDLTVQAIARKGWNVKFCTSAGSVVRDMGGLRGSRWNQAARHQSVTHLYPLRWRILFAASVVANVLALFGLCSLPFVEQMLFVAAALAIKLFVDGFAGILLSRRLKLDIGGIEVFAAALLLPAWTFWRAIAAMFGRTYVWRGRSMHERTLALNSASPHGS